MAREGWTKLPGSAERYRSPSGDVVSRRQYDNARFEGTPFQTRAQFERRHNDATYTHFIRELADQEGKTRKQVDRVEHRDAQLVFRAARAKRAGNMRPSGPLAKLLTRLGMRDPNATYNVGETPPRR